MSKQSVKNKLLSAFSKIIYDSSFEFELNPVFKKHLLEGFSKHFTYTMNQHKVYMIHLLDADDWGDSTISLYWGQSIPVEDLRKLVKLIRRDYVLKCKLCGLLIKYIEEFDGDDDELFESLEEYTSIGKDNEVIIDLDKIDAIFNQEIVIMFDNNKTN